MDTNIRQAQVIVGMELAHSTKAFVQYYGDHGSPMPVLESKEAVKWAQGLKWEAKRLARLAYALEVLESCEPRR
jgi:hypothetical protein